MVGAGGEVVGEGPDEFVFGDAAVSIVVELAEAVVEFGGVNPGAAEDRAVLIGTQVSAAVGVRSVEDRPYRGKQPLLQIARPGVDPGEHGGDELLAGHLSVVVSIHAGPQVLPPGLEGGINAGFALRGEFERPAHVVRHGLQIGRADAAVAGLVEDLAEEGPQTRRAGIGPLAAAWCGKPYRACLRRGRTVGGGGGRLRSRGVARRMGCGSGGARAAHSSARACHGAG